MWVVDLFLKKEVSWLELVLTEVPKEIKELQEILWCLFYSHISQCH